MLPKPRKIEDADVGLARDQRNKGFLDGIAAPGAVRI